MRGECALGYLGSEWDQLTPVCRLFIPHLGPIQGAPV